MQDLETIRGDFELDDDLVHFATMVMASHPDPVRRSIKKFRMALNRQSVTFFSKQSRPRRVEALDALQRYFGVPNGLGVITHSTTMGLAQVLGGIRMTPGQEFLISDVEHDSTLENVKLRQRRDGTPFKTFDLVARASAATKAEICDNVRGALQAHPAARVLALAWVYSSTGLKLPLSAIADVVKEENAKRAKSEQVLLVIDGVHGFGIENAMFPDLGCDFFVAGTHKSIFGPRGTAIIAGTRDAWAEVVPLMPSLAGAAAPATEHMPGGVKAYEHWWALAEAFEYHLTALGKPRIEAHVHRLATAIKQGIKDHVAVVTPMTPDLSSGIVCFDIEGQSASTIVSELEKQGILASTSSPDDDASGISHARLSVSVLNSSRDVERVVTAIKEIAKPAPK